jgi:hypothetical protein
MKKLLVLSLALFFAFSLSAQRYGLRLGGNFAGMMSTVESKGTKIAPGLNIGLVAEFGPKMISAHVEANYAQKGFNQETEKGTDDGTMTVASKINFDYLEVPVLLKVKLPANPLYFYAGPYFGLALNGERVSEYSLEGESLTDEQLDAFDLITNKDLFKPEGEYKEPIYKKTDFGIAGGLGAQFGLGPINAFVEGRATLGLSNLYDTESDAFQAKVDNELDFTDTEHLKNMVYTLGIGILFGK